MWRVGGVEVELWQRGNLRGVVNLTGGGRTVEQMGSFSVLTGF